MGCFGSKEDNRRKAIVGDYTGCNMSFKVGGVSTLEGLCPIDLLSLHYIGGKGNELKTKLGDHDAGALAKEKGEELGKLVFDAMKKFYFDSLDKSKEEKDKNAVFGKYSG